MKTSGEIKKYLEEFSRIKAGTEAIDKLDIYLRELIEWNKKFNITAITSPREIIIKHFIDSLSAAGLKEIQNSNPIMDTGSGGGFPGIPLSIVFPAKKFVLVESNKKKVYFLSHIKKILELKNIEIINERIENLSRNRAYRNKIPVIISRALANFSISLEINIGAIKKNGYYIYYTGDKQIERIQNLKKIWKVFGADVYKKVPYSLPNDMGRHFLIIVKKLWKTPDRYPRLYKNIKKNPVIA